MLKKIKFKGIGLLELLLVLAIVATILTTAVRYFNITSSSQKIADAMDRISAINTAAKKWVLINNNFSDTTTKSLTFASISAFVERGWLPSYFAGLKNPWNGGVEGVADSSTNFSTFTIKLDEVPSRDGKNLVEKIANSDLVCNKKDDVGFNNGIVTIKIKVSCD